MTQHLCPIGEMYLDEWALYGFTNTPEEDATRRTYYRHVDMCPECEDYQSMAEQLNFVKLEALDV